MRKKYHRPCEHRYVDIICGKYRLAVPIPPMGKTTPVFLPLDSSLSQIRSTLVKTMKEHQVSQVNIDYLMEGWPNKYNASGTIFHRHIYPPKRNHSGYLGVSCNATLKSVGFVSTLYKEGKYTNGVRRSVKLQPHGDGFSLMLWELERAFALACKDADELRGRPPKQPHEYISKFANPDWTPMLNKAHLWRCGQEFGFKLTVLEID